MNVAVRSTALLAGAALSAGLLSTPSTGAAADAPSVDLEPARLSRGPDIAIPHVDGDDFVDGDRRVDLPGQRVYLRGRSGDAYVVSTSSEDGLRNRRTLRVEADGSLTTLFPARSPYGLVLSEDGRRLVAVASGSRRASAVTVWSATTGDVLAKRSFRGHPSVLAARGRRVLLSSWDRGVFWWTPGRKRTRTVTMRPAGEGSITHDLLATYTDDPFLGGCTLLTRLSRPHRVLWRSCTERVDAFSPEGTRMTTVHILSDGIGPGRVVHREVDGTRLATYDSTGYFGAFSWESPNTLLLDTHGRRKSATVRCTRAACENATDPVRTDPLPG